MPRDYSKYVNRPGYEVPPGYDPSKFPRQSATADVVIFAFFGQRLNVLLVKRRKMPFQGYWAIPGGFVENDEDLQDAAARELFEETALTNIKLLEFGAFGHPRRDPRTRTITIAYLALARKEKIKPSAGDDAADVGWFPANKAPELAFDHELVLQSALKRLRVLAVLTPALFDLLPGKFSEKELTKLCLEIFRRSTSGKSLARNLKSAGLIRAAGKDLFRLDRKKFKPCALVFLFANSK